MSKLVLCLVHRRERNTVYSCMESLSNPFVSMKELVMDLEANSCFLRDRLVGSMMRLVTMAGCQKKNDDLAQRPSNKLKETLLTVVRGLT
jgi:hypothetical protein